MSPQEVRHKDNELVELMPRIVSRENMLAAYQAVKSNAGAAGIDEMSVEALSHWMREHWEQTKASLLEGRYEPQPVKRVELCLWAGSVSADSSSSASASNVIKRA